MKDGEIVTKQGDEGFRDVHPSPSSHPGPLPGRDLPPWQGTDGLESKFKRCKQCGFVVDTLRTPRGSGWGNEAIVPLRDLVTTDNGNPILDEDDNPTYVEHDTKKDLAAASGCPFCFSSEF